MVETVTLTMENPARSPAQMYTYLYLFVQYEQSHYITCLSQ
jgi:hypothetical protein